MEVRMTKMLRLTEEQLAARAQKLYRMANGSTIDVVDSGDEKLVSVPLGKKAKQKRVAVPTEHAEQCKVIQWCDAHPIAKHIFAIPNGSHKSPAAAAKFKREGLRPGVPDLFLPVTTEHYSGLFIEMKRTKGSVTSPAQTEWFNYFNLESNYLCFICEGADEAIEEIQHYLAGNP